MFPDPELLRVLGRGDLPQAVRLELERSAFLRGSTVAFNEKRDARYIRARYDAPDESVRVTSTLHSSKGVVKNMQE
jgi:hypothetical protein